MSYELNITLKPGFLHAIVTGRNTPETNRGYLEELLHRCVTLDCRNVLIEERLRGRRLSATQIFEIASQMTLKALGKVKVLAFVDVNAEDQWNTKFGETTLGSNSKDGQQSAKTV